MTISIITVVYNGQATIRDTMESVLSQSCTDYEHWVIDGGSTDGTLDVVREYEERYQGRLHWISEKDRGLYDAMNKGIQRAQGDVIGFLNSDDFFASRDIVRTLVDVFSRQPELEGVYGDVRFVDGKNLDKTVRYYSSASFRPYKLRFGFMPAHPSFYVRRQVYEQCGLYAIDYLIASDYDMCVRLFHQYHIHTQYLPMLFTTMRTGGVSNNSVAHRLKITQEDVRACRRYGLYTNSLLVSFKYFTKVFEFLPHS